MNLAEIIYLKKSGLYVRSRGKAVKISRPIAYYMHYSPKIAKGFTVLDLMELLRQHQNDVDQYFLSYTRGFTLDPFYDEVNKPTEKDDGSSITEIEFSWVTNVDNFKEFGKPAYEISEYIHLTGRKGREKDGYGISLSNLYELRNATLKLNDRIEYSTINRGEIWEDKKSTKQIFLRGRKAFNLENIIGSFLNEITYFGYPSDRNHQSDELEALVENRDSTKFTPHEEVMLKWKKDDLIRTMRKKDTKLRTLKIEKLNREIDFLKQRLTEINANKTN